MFLHHLVRWPSAVIQVKFYGDRPGRKRSVVEFMQESIVFSVRVQCPRKESSRSLSHLMMSFLLRLHWNWHEPFSRRQFNSTTAYSLYSQPSRSKPRGIIIVRTCSVPAYNGGDSDTNRSRVGRTSDKTYMVSSTEFYPNQSEKNL